jgi:hypothetical protein
MQIGQLQISAFPKNIFFLKNTNFFQKWDKVNNETKPNPGFWMITISPLRGQVVGKKAYHESWVPICLY